MSFSSILDGQNEPVAIVGMGEILSPFPFKYSKFYFILNGLICTQDVDGQEVFEILPDFGTS